MRIKNHPILGKYNNFREINITVNGKNVVAYEGEMIASAIVASGTKVFRLTEKSSSPRGLFCAIGRCTDCIMEVNGVPNVRTCVTPVEEGMVINTQKGLGMWKEEKN